MQSMFALGWAVDVKVAFRLIDLAEQHSGLLWETIVTTAVAVLSEPGRESPYAFSMAVDGVYGFGSETVEFLFDGLGIAREHVDRIRRTYEPSRLVEMAAIAVAGAGLTVAGGHEI